MSISFYILFFTPTTHNSSHWCVLYPPRRPSSQFIEVECLSSPRLTTSVMDTFSIRREGAHFEALTSICQGGVVVLIMKPLNTSNACYISCFEKDVFSLFQKAERNYTCSLHPQIVTRWYLVAMSFLPWVYLSPQNHFFPLLLRVIGDEERQTKPSINT